ncbi:pentapeptide repeat-containing protein [Streptomyces filamentosus]|uniref:pentapeptide repeat-containing protein n=1 Tax=Streptomyces filamentosus TaxID=67294 RepID=UPI0034102C83
MSRIFRRRRTGLRLWPVGRVLALAFLVALAVAAGVFYAGWGLLGVRGIKTEGQLDSKTLFDLVKLSFGVVAGAGALVALIVAYRRQRVDEDGARRDATRLHNERFTSAVSQLGDDSPAVRLGGVHALAGLADDAPSRELRQTCVDVLCAYLRLPYTREGDVAQGDEAARHGYLALREVRHTVIRVVRDHLRLLPEDPRSWHGCDFDFTGVVFDGGDFSEAVFRAGRANFNEAVFEGVVRFERACFTGGRVSFSGIEVRRGGTVVFDRARFSSRVAFRQIVVRAGGGLRFTGAHFGDGGTVDFRDSLVQADGMISFAGSVVDAGGALSLADTVVEGGVVGLQQVALEGGAITLADAFVHQGGSVRVTRASLSSGALDLQRVDFRDGSIRFLNSSFAGATVNFADAVGAPPGGLPLASSSPWLTVPIGWAAASLDGSLGPMA